MKKLLAILGFLASFSAQAETFLGYHTGAAHLGTTLDQTYTMIGIVRGGYNHLLNEKTKVGVETSLFSTPKISVKHYSYTNMKLNTTSSQHQLQGLSVLGVADYAITPKLHAGIKAGAEQITAKAAIDGIKLRESRLAPVLGAKLAYNVYKKFDIEYNYHQRLRKNSNDMNQTKAHDSLGFSYKF